MYMKKKQEGGFSKKKFKITNSDLENNCGIKQTAKFPNMVNVGNKNNFISQYDSFTTRNKNKGHYLYYKQDMFIKHSLGLKQNKQELRELLDVKPTKPQTSHQAKLEPIVIEVNKDEDKDVLRHKYSFPSLPMSTMYIPRCTTAFCADSFGHFNNNRFKEYRQLKNIFDSHNLNKYKYVVDPIFYTSDDTLRKELDLNYRNYIFYMRYRKNNYP